MAVFVSPKLNLPFSVSILAALFVVAPSYAAPLGSDGSGSNNPTLLRGTYSGICANPEICGPIRVPATVSVQVATPVSNKQVKTDQPVDCSFITPKHPAWTACVMAQYGVSESAPVPEQPQQPTMQGAPYLKSSPQFEADWSLELRGSYETGTNGQRFGISTIPSVSFTRQIARGSIRLGADVELMKESGDQFRLSNGALDFTGSYQVNDATTATFGAQVGVSQDSPYQLTSTIGVAEFPIVTDASADVSIERRFGRFGVQGSANIDVRQNGGTLLSTGAISDNSYLNRFGYGGAIRTSYKLTEKIDVFAVGSASRSLYESPSPSQGDRLNSWTYAVQGGVQAIWRDNVEVSLAGGYGIRQYDSALISDAPTALIDAELVYRPHDSLSFAAGFTTDFSTAETTSGATTQIDYAATGSVNYLINDRVSVRANGSGQWTQFVGTGDTETTYSAGVGADFTLNAHTKLSADYSYGMLEGTNTVRAQKHQVSVGMRYAR